MELVLGRGFKYSYFMVPRISNISVKLPLFCSQCPVNANRQIQNLARQLSSSNQSINFSLFNNQQDRKHKYGFLANKINTIEYSTSSKSESAIKTAETSKDSAEPPVLPENVSKLQKMKQMAKDYWYILIPVHLITSAGWTLIFYTSVKNGFDIVGVLESLNLSEKYLEMLRGSSAGHWAATYALYKVFTPIRYTITLGTTTMCIRYLNRWGYLKFKNPKLVQSIKSAAEHKYAQSFKSSTSSKTSTQSPKT